MFLLGCNLPEIKKTFKKIKLKTWLLLLFIVGLGFYLRITFPGCDSGDGLTFYYVFNAIEMLKTRTIPTMHLPVGYAALLSIVFLIFGISYQTLLLFNIFLSTLTIILVFCITYLLFKNEYASLMSSLFMALFPVAIFFSHLCSSNVPFVFFISFSTMILLVSLKENKMKTYFLAFSLLIFTNSIRMETSLFFPFFGFGFLFYKKLRLNNIRKIIKSLLLSLIFIIPLIYFFIEANILFGAVPNNPIYEGFSKTFSVSYLKTNLAFHLSSLLATENYPIFVFLAMFVGILLSLLWRKYEFLFPVLWLLIFFLFYGLYWHTTFGSPYLYQLLIHPPLSILAGSGFGLLIDKFIEISKRLNKKKITTVLEILLIIFSSIIIIYYFWKNTEIFNPQEREFCLSKKIIRFISTMDKEDCLMFEEQTGDQLRLFDYINFIVPSRGIVSTPEGCQGKTFYLKIDGKRFNFVFGESNNIWKSLKDNYEVKIISSDGDLDTFLIEIFEVGKRK